MNPRQLHRELDRAARLLEELRAAHHLFCDLPPDIYEGIDLLHARLYVGMNMFQEHLTTAYLDLWKQYEDALRLLSAGNYPLRQMIYERSIN